MEDNEASHDERSAVLKKEANAVELGEMRRAHRKFDAAAKVIEKKSIEMANAARELGIHLQTLSGMEQISFEFWTENCEGKVPFSFDTGKMFMKIARRMEKPAESVAEALEFVQPALIADGLLQLPQRAEPQKKSTISAFEQFLTEITLLRVPFEKVVTTMPMKHWDQATLNRFLSEAEWLSAELRKAEGLLQPTGTPQKGRK